MIVWKDVEKKGDKGKRRRRSSEEPARDTELEFNSIVLLVLLM